MHTAPKKTNTHSDADIARATELFFGVRRMLRSKLAEGKKRDPSTWLRVETMKFIAENTEPKMKELAEYLSITAPSATSLINGLMKAGLVRSSTDAKDRRAQRLVLTTKGQRELTTALARGMTLFGEAFSSLSPSELTHFTRALRQLIATED